MRFIKCLSPFLMAIFSVTSLWSQNAERFGVTETGTPLVYALLVAGIFLLLFWLSKWASHAAPLGATIYTLIFLIWYEIPWPASVFFMLAVIPLCTWEDLKPVANRVSTALPFILTFAIIVTLVHGSIIRAGDKESAVSDYTYIPDQRNIYFIVPDRMPSPAAMEETGIDCAGFIKAFEDIGFYIPYDYLSSDPYTPDYSGTIHTTRTMRFFAAALNSEEVTIDISYKRTSHLIKYSEAFDKLHEKGYRITNVASWFSETASFPTADCNLRFDEVSFLEHLFYSEFNCAYYNRTLISRLNIRAWESESSIARVERNRHQWQYDSIVELASSGETSQFVIAHILLPHEPFVYSDHFPDSVDHPDAMQKYIYQIRFAQNYLIDLAAAIREVDPTAFVIIQSDEGMAFRREVELSKSLSNTQWNGVFCGWYIPEYVGDLVGIEHYEILRKVANG